MELTAQRDLLAEDRLERPFHFAIVLWGERFRNYFLEYCLPSLLSPGNIPSLRTRTPSKFLIATRPEDWSAMSETAIFRKLATYIEPVYLEIPPCPPGRSGCEHMGKGDKLACAVSFQEKAYVVRVSPDCMFSDGTIARIQELAGAGYELAVCAALRFGEEPLFSNLHSRGLLPSESPALSGRPSPLPARDLAWACINGLHTETISYEWDAPYFGLMPAAAWWRVPNEDGMVVHSLSWFPLLVDFAAIPQLDVSMLDYWTIDGDFLQRNIGQSKAIYVVDDSDEAFVASWAPMREKVQAVRRLGIFENSLLRQVFRSAELRRTYYGPYLDDFKRRHFLRTVRWHGRSLSPAWRKVERDALRSLSGCIDEVPEEDGAQSRVWKVTFKLTSGALSVFEPVLHVWFYRDAVRRRLRQILRGNPDAVRRVVWHLERAVHQLAGRAFNKPAPKPPA